MIVVYTGVAVDIDIEASDEWAVVHRDVGGEETLHEVSDPECWCSPVCIRVGEHTHGEITSFYTTSLH